ncbi:mucin-3B-like [Hydra vulgaris]|uniref:Mucin-3B-like n=1 Tax=Hydra vulgaris TaxID=6087 RepID=A0ABM4BVP6_HYDVU
MYLIFNSALIYFLYKCSFIKSEKYISNSLSTRVTIEAPVNLSDFSKKKTFTTDDGSRNVVSSVSSIPYQYVSSFISNSYVNSIYIIRSIEKSTEYSFSEINNNFSKLSKITYNLPSYIETKNATQIIATAKTLEMSLNFLSVNDSYKSVNKTSVYQLVSNNNLTLLIVPTANTLIFPTSVASENSINFSTNLNSTEILFSNLPSSIALSELSVMSLQTNFFSVKSISFQSIILFSVESTINSSSSTSTSENSMISLSTIVLPSEKSTVSSEKVTFTPSLTSSPNFSNQSQVNSHSVSNMFKTSKIIFSVSASLSTSIISSVIPESSCEQSTETFSNAMTNMTQCIIIHTNPMQICLKCAKYYDMLQIYHKYLVNNCIWLVSQSNKKYQVITEVLQAQERTWQSLGCEKCYIPNLVARTVTPEFKRFLDLKYKVESCFRNVSLKSQIPNSALSDDVAINNTKFNNTWNVCSKCSDVSMNILRNYKYREDNDDNSDALWCADINVAVTEIKELWNKNYKCNKQVVKEFLTVIAITSFFCFLPVIFYVGAKLHFDVNERKNANRYSQSE